MTVLEADAFVASIPGFNGLPPAVQTDLLAYYLLNHLGSVEVTAATISSLRAALHLQPHKRISPYLSEQTTQRAGRKVRYVKASAGYVLERGYAEVLRTAHLGRPSATNIATSLRNTLSAIGDPAVRSYLEEAMACFEHNMLRSALIMTWCVAFGLLRSWLFRNHLAVFNLATSGWKNPVTISTLDDFQELTEATIIDTARKSKILTKEQHKTLRGLLDLRNSYAHPTSKPIKAASVEAYIHTVLDEVVPTYG